ncbi:MAG: hypothetical protein QM731_06255 [Chitinophagaceae bacterium]
MLSKLLSSLLVTVLLLSSPATAQYRKKNFNSFGLSFGIPWVSTYCFHNYELQKADYKIGFFGFSTGIFYKTPDYKISLSGGFTSDLPAPIGPVDYGHKGTRAAVSSFYLEALHHQRIVNRLYAVGGINSAWYRYKLISYEDSIKGYTRTDPAYGITVGAEYVVARFFSAGIFYRPALITKDPQQYRHLITMDLRFDINLIRWRKNVKKK